MPSTTFEHILAPFGLRGQVLPTYSRSAIPEHYHQRSKNMEILFLIGRILVGVYFIYNAVNHFKNTDALTGYAAARNLPSPRLGTYASGVFILLGGLGVLLGVYTDVAIALLVIFLVTAAFGIHHFWTDTDPMQKMGEQVNFAKNLALAGALLMALMIPELPYSITL
jgi:putative oxidoreductase